ncbi:CRISPR-associated Csh1 family protein [Candidatus Magnetoovum chiemensis]|nr:CRISPR-associated Csh1 family protein [Candidatus Magnetoovum chiemensis]
MLTAIKHIGDITSGSAVDYASSKGGKVISIVLDCAQLTYTLGPLEDFDNDKKQRYLFKEGESKGNPAAPFAQITKPDKTFNKKIYAWLNNCEKELKKIPNTTKEDKELLTAIIHILSKSDAVIKDIEDKITDLPKKDKETKKDIKYYLTVKPDAERYLGDIPMFKSFKTAKAASKSAKHVKRDQFCSMCKEQKEQVFKIDLFKFYTIDKPGFIASGFNKKEASKNFPVCQECKTSLETGKAFYENKLKFKFYGLSYYLIPSVLSGESDVLDEILDIVKDSNKRTTLKNTIKRRLTSDENEILEYLSKEEDTLTLNIVFLDKSNNSAERILLLIEDVLPSRLRTIFDAKDYVDRIFNPDDTNDRGFDFGRIRTFYDKSAEKATKSDLNAYFLEIVDSVFKLRPLELSFLLRFMMAAIRRAFVNDKDLSRTVKYAMMDIMFFQNLGLISFEEVNTMQEESMFEAVFKKYEKSFSAPVKRGIFLLGALTQLFLNAQRDIRGASPFRNKLKGLKMNEKDIKALLPKVEDKITQYLSFDKCKWLILPKLKIGHEVSQYLLEAGDNWNMTVDEINFYFVCGMYLSQTIANIVYPKKEEKE